MRGKIFIFIGIFVFLTFFSMLDKPITTNEFNNLLGGGMSFYTGEPHPPFWYLILGLWNLIGIGAVVSRILPLIFGVLSIIFMYKLGKLMFGSRVGEISCLILSMSPYLIFYSRTVERYSLFVFLAILNFYAFIKYFKRGSGGNLVFLFLSSLVLMQTHFYGLFLLSVELIYVFFKQRSKFLKVFIVFFVIGLSFIPQIIVTLDKGAYEYPYDEPWHDIIIPLDAGVFSNLFHHLVVDGIGWYGLVMLIWFYYLFFRNFRFISGLFFLLLPLLMFVLSFFINIRYYQFIFLLPFFVLFFSKYAANFKKYSFIGVVIVLSCFGIVDQYDDKSRVVDNLEIIELNWGLGDIVICDGYYARNIEYYTTLRYHNYSFLELSNPGPIVSKEKLKFNRVWIVYNDDLRRNDRFHFDYSTIGWIEKNCEHVEGGFYVC